MSPATQRIRERGRATVGVVGTGEISRIYVDAVAASPVLELKACAARSVESAAPTAKAYGVEAVTLEALVADQDLAEAILEDRPHRASGELAVHVLDVLERILEEVR